MSQVEIQPSPSFLGRQQGHYAFAYEITITNRCSEPVQLLNRHWIITHGNGQIEEVYGEGVVGQQPRLNPGQSFTYQSGALIPTRNGSMSGSYEFTDDAGERFRVAIPEFVLAAPESLH
ncbi:Co2+/Mg2+ efflux protein ApaG [Elongatibacter sediminis]|uniref:Co2+/Mg2+ efflux protein ApaG n=1 Tax=Elongatibacter sediminis TaxID=3119006 RepID=A0AAW9RIE0_9GAMM